MLSLAVFSSIMLCVNQVSTVGDGVLLIELVPWDAAEALGADSGCTAVPVAIVVPEFAESIGNGR